MAIYRNLSQIAINANTNNILSENYAAKQALLRGLPGGDVAGGGAEGDAEENNARSEDFI